MICSENQFVMDFINYSMNKNLPITANMIMADVIHLDYSLIPIVGRFDIDFGFGNKTVREVCEQKDINIWFFLEILNSYHNHDYFPKKQLQNFSVGLITRYLSNTHKFYLEHKVPEIDLLIDNLIEQAAYENRSNLQLLKTFFIEYVGELKSHLNFENNKVFPYVERLGIAVDTGKVSEKLYRSIRDNSIEKYEQDHDDLEEKLFDMKNLILKYMPPVINKNLCQNLLFELFNLENDLVDHTRIENKVLIPKVKLLEQKILETRENY